MLSVENLPQLLFGQFRNILNMASPPDKSDKPDRAQHKRQCDMRDATNAFVQTRASRRAPQPTSPEAGSLLHIMRQHAGKALYTAPICWTDLHAQLLDVHFGELEHVTTPVPSLSLDPAAAPSESGRFISSELMALVDPTRSSLLKTRSIKGIMSFYFPDTTSARTRTLAELDLYFGDRLLPRIIKLPIVWTSVEAQYPGISFNSASTVPISSFSRVDSGHRESSSNAPVLAYLNKSQLSFIRNHLYRVAAGPNGQVNLPVHRLRQLRSKQLEPSNADCDVYFAAVLLAMAQAHIYKRSRSPTLSPESSQDSSHHHQKKHSITMLRPQFRDVKVQLMTTVDDAEEFIIYTAEVSAAFLRRFGHPDKAPTGDELAAGMHISCTKVPMFPLLGLRERLSKVLLPAIAGHDHPSVCGDAKADTISPYWCDLLVARPPPPAADRSRKRRMDDESLGRSFDSLGPSSYEDDDNRRDDAVQGSPRLKRQRVVRSMASLEVF